MQEGDEQDNFHYTSGQPVDPVSAPQPQSAPTDKPENGLEGIFWKASEFIDHQKSSLWFLGLIAATIVVGLLMYLLTRDILATIVVLVAGATAAVFANKKPRTLSYTLLPSAIKIEGKTYHYEDFRSFSVIQDGALFSVVLQPVKRLMPPLTIYFDHSDGEKIFDALAQHLPHEEKELDFVDKMMRKIRF